MSSPMMKRMFGFCCCCCCCCAAAGIIVASATTIEASRPSHLPSLILMLQLLQLLDQVTLFELPDAPALVTRRSLPRCAHPPSRAIVDILLEDALRADSQVASSSSRLHAWPSCSA